ncbi:MAG: hypothetical protein HZA93_13160 [Verrucomicrobia bacterium]|nr:hypothetical protein [Verrucomicrobiota bacterium]
MSTQRFSHLLPLLEMPDAEFDALWDDLVRGNPDLQTPGSLEMPVTGFRSMMKLAFIAGKIATAEQISLPK